MGTKLNPGAFDCLGDAEPNEPFFTLLGRDLHAAKLVRIWAKERAEAISRGDYPPIDALKVTEAYECAAKMEEYRAGRERRLEVIGAKAKPLVKRVEGYGDTPPGPPGEDT
jgi:hypothetical protein